MAEGHVDAGIALIEAMAELVTLRELVATTKPVCPHCKTEMVPTEYVGYYDGFCYWDCECSDLPPARTWKGGYA